MPLRPPIAAQEGRRQAGVGQQFRSAHDSLLNRLREERDAKGWTQAELAARVGVSRKTINTVENRVFTPSATLAIKLAQALGLSVEQLFWIER